MHFSVHSFQDKSVYLLDDPLAAVDAHVAAHLYQHCIRGLLGDKTVILCTHHRKYLKDTDFVIHMEHGKIAQMGWYIFACQWSWSPVILP